MTDQLLQYVIIIFMLFLCVLCLFAVLVIARDVVIETVKRRKDKDEEKVPTPVTIIKEVIENTSVLSAPYARHILPIVSSTRSTSPPHISICSPRSRASCTISCLFEVLQQVLSISVFIL